MTVDLDHHGDADAAPGLLDLAVNVRAGGPPPWLLHALGASLAGLARYPDPRAATEAVARVHGRPVEEVLLTAGAAEASVLIAHGLDARRAVVVHPQFTEPERALRAAGVAVVRHVLRAEDGFTLDPAGVDRTVDLVMVGNPTNPTGVLHPRETLLALCRPGRTVVVDEAFLDAVPGQPDSLAEGAPRGVLVVRSLTKTWGLAGLRIGYVLGAAPVLAQLRARQPRWSVSAPALVAAVACSSAAALAEAGERAGRVSVLREELRHELHRRGLRTVPGSAAPFLLVQGPRPLVAELRTLGVAVRPAQTFPGLDDTWFRTAVRDDGAHSGLLDALDRLGVTRAAVPHG